MIGVHVVKFVRAKDGFVRRRLIEAIEMSPDFSRARAQESIQNQIYDWLTTAESRDKIIIETELQE